MVGEKELAKSCLLNLSAKGTTMLCGSPIEKLSCQADERQLLTSRASSAFFLINCVITM